MKRMPVLGQGRCPGKELDMNMNSNQPDNTVKPGAEAPVTDIRHLSQEQLAQLGLAKLAYVKPIITDGAKMFAIHAADGTPMALAEEFGVAVAAIAQHEMVPVSVH
jgi:hypothetical protein